jgi:hypothetical protein
MHKSGAIIHTLLAVAAVLAVALPERARAEALVVDLSNHLVAITTGFTGTNVLLFGAVQSEGDVIVTVKGPDQDMVVRRKERRHLCQQRKRHIPQCARLLCQCVEPADGNHRQFPALQRLPYRA